MRGEWDAERAAMVRRDLAARGITDEGVLAAMASVPREEFVRETTRRDAYADGPLPIECGQTISQPFVVAWMAELAELGSDDRVLEIGTGSGYAAAVLSMLAGTVISLERHGVLADSASDRLQRLGYPVQVHTADGLAGWPQGAPYDAIVVAAATATVPGAWFAQLARGGRIVVPLGGPQYQELTVLTAHDGGADGAMSHDRRSVGGVRFVPLLRGIGTRRPPGSGSGRGGRGRGGTVRDVSDRAAESALGDPSS